MDITGDYQYKGNAAFERPPFSVLITPVGKHKGES